MNRALVTGEENANKVVKVEEDEEGDEEELDEVRFMHHCSVAATHLTSSCV